MSVTGPASPSHLAAVTAGLLAVVLGLVAGCASQGIESGQEHGRPTRVVVESSMPGMDLPTAIAQADAIVIGSVDREMGVTKSSGTSEEARRRLRDRGMSDEAIAQQVSLFSDWIYTTWHFNVERSLKGDLPGDGVEIRMPGGKLDGREMEVRGYPELIFGGSRQVVFLVRAWDGPYQAVAVYRVIGQMASTNDQGRDDDLTLEALIAQIEAHRNDPNPFLGAPSVVKAPAMSHEQTATPRSGAVSSSP